MAGCDYEHWSSPEEEETTAAAPEHLHAIDLHSIDAFLEEAVPEDMVAAAREEEEERLRRGGRPRSREDGVKEMLRLWAKSVVKKAVETVAINQQ
uniref:Uncharacterized protein n=1 Tax=Leersia perrieri TaxID=77586 RepID=A0A0D9XD46_9ORYZ